MESPSTRSTRPGTARDVTAASAGPAQALAVVRLLVLRAVHHHGGVLAAAERLGFTPSAVSQHLARLEADVRSGAWHRTHADLLALDALDVGYCTVAVHL